MNNTLFDWNLLDKEETLNELIGGLAFLNNSNAVLTFVATVMNEAGFTLKDVKDRIAKLNEALEDETHYY